MKKRILAVLLCLCLLAGLVPIGTTVFAADTTDYAIGDTVEFAGHYWYIIGTESKGEKAPSGCYTLFAKNNDFGDTNFGHKQTYQYMYSTLKEKMDEIAGSFSEEDKASIEAPDSLDGVTEPLLWPLSLNQLRSISANMQQFEKDYYTRTATYDGANSCAYASFYRVSDGALSSCLSNETKAVRPALYVKAEALPETVMGIQVRSAASGGMSWARVKTARCPARRTPSPCLKIRRKYGVPRSFRRKPTRQVIWAATCSKRWLISAPI